MSIDKTNYMKYNARKAILNALIAGRHLSQLNCGEFMIEDMRTPISHLRDKFPPSHELKTTWVKSPVRGARIKEYWLERR